MPEKVSISIKMTAKSFEPDVAIEDSVFELPAEPIDLEQEVQQIQKCSEAFIFLQNGIYDSATETLDLIVWNSGRTNLTGFNVTITPSNKSMSSSISKEETIAKGETKTLSISPISSDIKQVEVVSNECKGARDMLLEYNIEGLTSAKEETCTDTETQETMSYLQARSIALESGECCGNCTTEYNCTGCLKEGTELCNSVTGTWWIDLDLEMEGCAPACVVDIANRTAEINWRCTGLIPEPTTPVYDVSDCESRGQLPWCDIGAGETSVNCPQDCSNSIEGTYIQKDIQGYTLSTYSYNNGLSNFVNITERVLISYVEDASQQNAGVDIMHFDTPADAVNFVNDYIQDMTDNDANIQEINFGGSKISKITYMIYDSWLWRKDEKVIKVSGFIGPEDSQTMPTEIVSSYLVKFPAPAFS